MKALKIKIMMFIYLTGCLSYVTNSKVNWTSANEHCRTQKKSLIELEYFSDHKSFSRDNFPIWTTNKEIHVYTPWIAYKGCYWIWTKPIKNIHLVKASVGKCYWSCLSFCNSTSQMFFALKKTQCYCYCTAPKQYYLMYSRFCNLTCSSSFEDGECDEKGKTKHRAPCLVCSKNISDSSNITVNEVDCKEKALGLCVSKENKVNENRFEGTFNSYWNSCKIQDKFITGVVHERLCQDVTTWTGIRQYNIDEVCLCIDIDNNTLSYKEINCSEHLDFNCQKDTIYTIRQKTFLSYETMGIILALSLTACAVSAVVFVVWYCRKRRNRNKLAQMSVASQQQGLKTVNCALYDDVMSTSRHQYEVLRKNISTEHTYDTAGGWLG